MVRFVGLKIQILSFALNFCLPGLNKCDDDVTINPVDEPAVLVNLRCGRTNDEGSYERGVLHPSYFFDIDGVYVDVKSVKGLQADLSSFSSTPKKGDRVLFLCRKRFKVHGGECADDVWLEGEIVRLDQEYAEILASSCVKLKSRTTTFQVVTERVENLRKVEKASRKRPPDIRRDVCADETVPTSIFYEYKPGCAFYKFRLIYPRQSFVLVRTMGGEKDTMIRTDIDFHVPPVILDRVPDAKNLENGRDVVFRTDLQKRIWQRGILRTDEKPASLGNYAAMNEKGKKTENITIDGVRLVRGRVMNLCESVLDDRRKGQSPLFTNQIYERRFLVKTKHLLFSLERKAYLTRT